MKKTWFYFTTAWRSVLLTTIASSIIIGILVFQLGTLTHNKVNTLEAVNVRTNSSYKNTLQQPVNAPYYLVRNTLTKFHKKPSVVLPRLVSVIFAFITIIAFSRVLSLWYETRVAALGIVMFASSSWLLHIARTGLPDILQSLCVVLILFSLWLQRTNRKPLAFLGFVFSIGLLLYVPGIIWLLLAGGLWRGKQLLKEARDLPKLFLIGGLLALVTLLVPLAWSIFQEPKVILWQLAGIPSTVNYHLWLTNLRTIPTQLFFRSPINAVLNVGTMPLLDIFTSIMVIIGIYTSAQDWRLDRNKLTFGLLLIGILVTTLGSSPLLTILLVPMYLLATAGIAHMLDEWFSVFPRNPLARGIATTLISVAVLCVAFYHVTNYFIAWPNSPATRAFFSLHI